MTFLGNNKIQRFQTWIPLYTYLLLFKIFMFPKTPPTFKNPLARRQSICKLNFLVPNEVDGANYEMDGVKHEIDGVNLEIDGENHVK